VGTLPQENHVATAITESLNRSESAAQLREELVRKREWLIKLYTDAAGQLQEFWPLANRVA